MLARGASVWALLAAGSVAGGLARYAAAGVVSAAAGATFPYGTLVVNLSGCLFVGLFDALAAERVLLGPSGRLLLMTGFCGAYTTFSTLILETSRLLGDGEFGRAAANALGSLALGLVLFRFGQWLGRVI